MWNDHLKAFLFWSYHFHYLNPIICAQQRCTLSQSVSRQCCNRPIYIWPTFVSLVSFWAFAQVWGFSLLLFPASLFALWSRPRYPKLLRSWNLHLMQTRFVQAMPALIRSNFHASVIPWSSGNLGSCTHRPKFLSSSTMAFTRQLYLLNVESLALIYLYLINNLKWCSRITLFFKKTIFQLVWFYV